MFNFLFVLNYKKKTLDVNNAPFVKSSIRVLDHYFLNKNNFYYEIFNFLSENIQLPKKCNTCSNILIYYSL